MSANYHKTARPENRAQSFAAAVNAGKAIPMSRIFYSQATKTQTALVFVRTNRDE